MPAIDEFRALHRPGKPLILFNVWDAGSARAVAQEGARAIATGSYGVAGAQGLEDDESFPITEVLSNARRIITATDLPVTVDFSAGYGDSPEAAGGPSRLWRPSARSGSIWKTSCRAKMNSIRSRPK